MERLQKRIAECGICSRRKAEELILAGKVKVIFCIVASIITFFIISANKQIISRNS